MKAKIAEAIRKHSTKRFLEITRLEPELFNLYKRGKIPDHISTVPGLGTIPSLTVIEKNILESFAAHMKELEKV